MIGLGGVGSWAAEALARSGVGHLILIDLDHVAESNINRQIQATDNTLGQAKVWAMRDRLITIHPDCRIDCIEAFIAPDNLDSTLPECDVIIDAIDQVEAKTALIAHCHRRERTLITTGGAGGRTDPSCIRIADLSCTTHDPLAAKVRANLRRHFGFPHQQPFDIECVYSVEPLRQSCGTGLACTGYGSSVCVTAVFGLAAASRALASLLGSS